MFSAIDILNLSALWTAKIKSQIREKDDKNSKRNAIIIAGLTSYGGCCLIFRILLYSQTKEDFKKLEICIMEQLFPIKQTLQFQT